MLFEFDGMKFIIYREDRYEDVYSMISEVVEGMSDIKTLNIEDKIGSHLSNKLNTVANNFSDRDLLESRY